MKKTLSIIMALVLLFGVLSGCSKTDDDLYITEITPEIENEIREIYGFKGAIDFKCGFGKTYAIIPYQGENDNFQTVCEVVGGLDFVYERIPPLVILCDGERHRLPEAYEKGLIDDEELYKIFKSCKRVCTKTLDQDFYDNQISLWIMPSYNDRVYTVEDFAEVNCIELRDYGSECNGKLDRHLKLTIEGNSKENVLQAAQILTQRDDIYLAEPLGRVYLDVEPNDYWFE